MKYFWKCNICGAKGRDWLPHYKALRGARSHSRTHKEMDVVLTREDGRVFSETVRVLLPLELDLKQPRGELSNGFSREIQTK